LPTPATELLELQIRRQVVALEPTMQWRCLSPA
jgi:hypothetical protein